MTRNYLDYIEDIVHSISLIEKFTCNIDFPEFVSNEMLNYAVVRGLEIIGEASKNIPDEIKNEYPDIPWNKMSGIRNKIVHEYFGISLKIIWNVAKKELPPLRKPLIDILKSLEDKIEDK